MYLRWEKPRRFVVRLYKKPEKGYVGHHETLGIVALSVREALDEAQKRKPDFRVESVNDSGQVDFVVAMPTEEKEGA